MHSQLCLKLQVRLKKVFANGLLSIVSCQSQFKCVLASAEAEQKEEHRVWNQVSPVLDAVSLKKGVASKPLKNRQFVIDITKSKQFFRTQWI